MFRNPILSGTQQVRCLVLNTAWIKSMVTEVLAPWTWFLKNVIFRAGPERRQRQRGLIRFRQRNHSACRPSWYPAVGPLHAD